MALTCSSRQIYCRSRLAPCLSLSSVLLDDTPCSHPDLVEWNGSRLCRFAERKTWGATQRGFFLGDFFLCTSKERSYPLGRKPSGSLAFQKQGPKHHQQSARTGFQPARE